MLAWLGSYFKHVQVLELSRNELAELPSSLVNISTLVRLSLDSNLLSSLPNSIHLPSIVEISARDNKLTDLPISLFRCKTLEVLHLEGNPLRLDSRSLVVDLPRLRSLTLEANEKLPAVL